VEGRFLRPDQEPDADELMERSLPVPGTAVRVLAPEDNLLQVALHTAKHSYVRAPGFRLHLDVDRIVNGQPIDWQVFVERVHAHRVRTPVYFSLRIPAELLDTPVPEDVLRAIRPPRWKVELLDRWLLRTGLYRPNEPKFGRLEFIAFTASLYDEFGGLLRGVFPERAWMQDRYGTSRPALLPYLYARRIVDLVLRRMPT
jgi:hypothetical protein